MKYMVSWTTRANGSAADAEKDAKRAMQVFSKWSPPANLQMLQFVSRLDGQGGYALCETDDPAALIDGPAKFSAFNTFDITPVMDIMEAVPHMQEGIDFLDSIS
jgi:hypothetical protein